MIFRIAGMLLVRPLFRLRFSGRENIPQKGALIICCNHISYFDPVALALGVRRRIRFIAKSEFFTSRDPAVRFFFTAMGVIPIRRESSDTGAVNEAQRLLRNGEVIGIFPQGRIVRETAAFEPKAGAALLAVKTGAPVLPVSIFAKGKIRLFSKITVNIGKPVQPPDDASLRAAREFSEVIKKSIIDLQEVP